MCQKNNFICGGSSNPCKLVSVPESPTGHAPTSLECPRVTVCASTYSTRWNSCIVASFLLYVSDTIRTEQCVHCIFGSQLSKFCTSIWEVKLPRSWSDRHDAGVGSRYIKSLNTHTNETQKIAERSKTSAAAVVDKMIDVSCNFVFTWET